MLVQFSFKNFKLFQEEALIDFLPAPIHEHSDSLLRDPADGERLLPLMGIYGPNAGGKSTVLHALSCLTGLVTGSVSLSSGLPRVSCLNKPGFHRKPTEFDVLFRTQGSIFRYQLSFLGGQITKETLFYGGITGEDTGILYNRLDSRIHGGKELLSAPLDTVPPSVPLLAWLKDHWDSPHAHAAFDWFCSIRTQGSSPLPDHPGQKKSLCCLLQDLGFDITDYEIIPSRETPEPLMTVTHTPLYQDSPSPYTYRLPLKEESQGVQRLFSLLPPLSACLETGGLLIADDLDRVLHPQGLRCLIRFFHNREKNSRNAQLLFTAHNTALLQPAYMRRDEIWLCCAKPDGDRELYPLSSYKKENGLIPRNDEAYGKQYLEGRYGALPDIRTES